MITTEINRVSVCAESIQELIKKNKSPETVPWKSIWSSGIPHSVIMSTAGYCYKYEASLEHPVSPSQNYGVQLWRDRARQELVEHILQTPQSLRVYESLKQSYLINTDITDLLAVQTRGRNRLQKGGV